LDIDPKPRVGDFVTHKDPSREGTGVPVRADLVVTDVLNAGIQVSLFHTLEPVVPHTPVEHHFGAGVWDPQAFVLWRRP
jgi:hypothetical protein